MQRTTSIFLAALMLLITAASCNRPTCENTNEIFSRYTPDTKEYKEELANQLSRVDASGLSYWLKSYQKTNDSEFIRANIQGNGLCAEILLTIKDSRKGIEDIIDRKGGGYTGAELQNLKFDIIRDSVTTEFVFREVGNVVD